MPVAPRFAVCGKCCCVCKEPEALSSAVVGEIQGTQRSSHLLGLVCFLQVVLWLTQGEGALGLKEVKSCFWGGEGAQPVYFSPCVFLKLGRAISHCPLCGAGSGKRRWL